MAISDQTIRVCELFSGIGGFRAGLEKASSRFQTVYANEFDRFASSIYRHHWPDGTLQEADIRTVNPKNVSSFDLLVAGFPCQSFSLAGKRQGTNDPRGTLYLEILRFAKAKQPKMLLLENVPGLLSIEQGQVFREILWSLDELGYICEWKILNSKYFGVPQQRRRVFIIGYLAAFGRGGGTVFPIRESVGSCSKKVGVRQETCSTLTATYWKGPGAGRPLIVTPKVMFKNTNRSKVVSTVCPTLMSRMGTGGNNVPYVLLEDQAIRKLTLVECERLQGFPDNWTRHGLTQSGETVEISKTQRYKCLGNAVTVNVIEALGKLILDFYNRSTKP